MNTPPPMEAPAREDRVKVRDRVARTAHTCQTCMGRIAPGEAYKDVDSRLNGVHSHLARHPHCHARVVGQEA